MIHDKSFLGPEFLTWLFFEIRERGGDFGDLFGDGNDVLIAIGKNARAVEDNGGLSTAVKGSGLDGKREVLQAIAGGGLLQSLSIDVSIGHRVYGFTLDAFLIMNAVRLPDVFTDPNEDQPTDGGLVLDANGGEVRPAKKSRPKLPIEDVIDLRVQMLDELDRVVDEIYRRFVDVTTAPTERGIYVGNIRVAVANGLA